MASYNIENDDSSSDIESDEYGTSDEDEDYVQTENDDIEYGSESDDDDIFVDQEARNEQIHGYYQKIRKFSIREMIFHKMLGTV